MVFIISHNLTDPFLIDCWNTIHLSRQNLTIAVIGRTGTGKSEGVALKLAEMLDRRFQVNSLEEARKIINERVVAEGDEFVNFVDKSNIYGSVVIMDEAGAVGLPYEEWQSINSRLISTILQVHRYKRIITIFTMPSLKFLTVQARRHINIIVHTKKVHFDKKYVEAKVKIFEMNPETDQIYAKYPRYNHEKTKKVFREYRFFKINPYLAQAYEEWSRPFKDKVIAEVRAKMQAEKMKNLGKDNSSGSGITREFLDEKAQALIDIHGIKSKKFSQDRVWAEYPELPRAVARMIAGLVKEKAQEKFV